MTPASGTTCSTPRGMTPQALVLEADVGERLRFLGASTMRLTYDAGRDGALAFYEYTCQPGVAGAPQHVHHGHDETFYVVEGEFEFVLGDESTLLSEGGFVHVPREVPHGFRNAGCRSGRLVGTFNPSRFAGYFRELAEIIGRDGAPPDRSTWAELYGRYDTTFHPEG